MDKNKQSFKGSLKFNHVDAHFARFAMVPEKGKNDGSEIYGRRDFAITPGMFPADFELSQYDIVGSYEFKLEITKKN
jgi:hypothetical protein